METADQAGRLSVGIHGVWLLDSKNCRWTVDESYDSSEATAAVELKMVTYA